ncbi:FAD-dependent monooxygenase [Streptomyces sp. NBC_01352]|uniref:FAD-dependent monooxygenase n=1 Tax=Streptomyces sp. NBC_01352 TaxID=2903834 RepID=UPI002E36124C|nr:FAD-dependent monooxygenase [Streptomyces sp. NBC_01352]
MNAQDGTHRILIVGGGIAGLAAAIALSRRGDDVEVAELNTDWSVAGWGLSLTGPALRALDSLGLADVCADHGFGISNVTNCDSAGETMTTIDMPRLLGPERPAQAGLSRAVLHRILREEAVAQGVVLRTGVTADRLDESGDTVDVLLSDGSRRSVDVVVGADGIRSRTRDLLGVPYELEYTGQMVWRAIVPRPAWATALYTFAGPVYTGGLIPISQTQAYAFLTEDGVPPDPLPDKQLADRMRELMADFTGRVVAVREAVTDPEAVVRRPVQTCLVDGPWHRGRTVLIGDAVHAPSPQLVSGAALAIEDAVILAEELHRGDDTETALKAFGRRRLERSRLVVGISVRVSELVRDGHHTEAHQLQQQCHRALAEPA